MLAAIAVTTNPVPADVLLVDQPAENVKRGHNSLCSRRRGKKHTKCCRPEVAVPLVPVREHLRQADTNSLMAK